MDIGIISTRYAKAIYRFAADRGEETRLYEEMETLSRQFVAIPELKNALENPILSSEEKIKLLIAALEGKVSETAKNVFRVVVENRRAQYMQHIALVYDLVYRKAKNIVLVKLTTVGEASEEEKKSMVELVSNGGKNQVDFAVKSDADIIGGFILEVEDLRLDASVRNQLNTMKLELTK
ncbi:MAG: F0F1 ATP synthase subunit delta [Dysgonamonadaceae bacterium]|jgi:F-type H+-transporting ATPase subunit delta|nr:F0F1 ATP synthase subunit delta [Dysgonamonadaceae bacterium]